MEIEETKKQESVKKDGKSLTDFKRDYEVLRKKYSLPDYVFMNQNFEIELLSDIETDLLVKRIRKQVNDRVSAGLRTMEIFMNPQNAPLFILNALRGFNSAEKDIINVLYKKFAQFELEAFSLENKYDEKKEGEFIKNICAEWENLTKEMEKLTSAMKIGFNKASTTSEKSYFG